jgi:hypothetical protein
MRMPRSYGVSSIWLKQEILEVESIYRVTGGVAEELLQVSQLGNRAHICFEASAERVRKDARGLFSPQLRRGPHSMLVEMTPVLRDELACEVGLLPPVHCEAESVIVMEVPSFRVYVVERLTVTNENEVAWKDHDSLRERK